MAEPVSLAQALTSINSELKAHGITTTYTRKALCAELEAEWGLIKLDIEDGAEAVPWGSRVYDFSSPVRFLVFVVDEEWVEIWVGGAAVGAASARSIADRSRSPMVMLRSIKQAPGGWHWGTRVQRSDLRLT